MKNPPLEIKVTTFEPYRCRDVWRCEAGGGLSCSGAVTWLNRLAAEGSPLTHEDLRDSVLPAFRRYRERTCAEHRKHFDAEIARFESYIAGPPEGHERLHIWFPPGVS